MSRSSRNVELLERLIEWAGGSNQFYKLTGIRSGDQNHYLNGAKSIHLKRLKSAAHQVFGTPPAFTPLLERSQLPKKLPRAELDGKSGLYAFFSSSGSLLYFGKATNLYTEINQTLGRMAPKTLVMGLSKKPYPFRELTAYYSAYEVLRGDKGFRHDVETLVLRVARRDTLNTAGGHFTRGE